MITSDRGGECCESGSGPVIPGGDDKHDIVSLIDVGAWA